MLSACADTEEADRAPISVGAVDDVDDIAQEVADQVDVTSSEGQGEVDTSTTATAIVEPAPGAERPEIAPPASEQVESTVNTATATTAVTTSTQALVTPSTATTATTTSTSMPSATIDQPLTALLIAPEGRRDGYDRGLFQHWIDADGTGCDARQDVLAAQVIGLPQVDLFDRCVIVEGDWYSAYDAVVHSGSPSDLDVDHVVALAEAWDSGASAWSPDMRRQFANDPTNLLAVTASANRSKSDRDVAEWTPPARSSWCLTAMITIEVKVRYSLTVDRAEHDALVALLDTCGEAGQIGLGIATAPSVAVPTNPSTTEAVSAPSEQCIDINTASLIELDRIIHIGSARASAIVSLRPFDSVNELARVSGIGSSRLADIVAEGLACVR